ACETDGRLPWVFEKGGPRLYVYGTNIIRKGDAEIPTETAAKLKKMGLGSTGTGKKVGRKELMNLKLRTSTASAVWRKTRKPAMKVKKFRLRCPSCKAIIEPIRENLSEEEYAAAVAAASEAPDAARDAA
ncbi:unnamed protein product, partial [Symbiodinium sp. CCMP2592]